VSWTECEVCLSGIHKVRGMLIKYLNKTCFLQKSHQKCIILIKDFTYCQHYLPNCLCTEAQLMVAPYYYSGPFVSGRWKWQVRGRLRFLFNFEFCHTSNKRLKATQGYPKPVIKWEKPGGGKPLWKSDRKASDRSGTGHPIIVHAQWQPSERNHLKNPHGHL